MGPIQRTLGLRPSCTFPVFSRFVNTLLGMDNRVVTTVRLPADLAARLTAEAGRRGVSKTVVVQSALEQALGGGEPRESAPGPAGVRPGTPASASARPQAPPNYMLERQARLRREMGWDK